MLLPKFGCSTEAIQSLVEAPDDAGVLDELPRSNHEDLCYDAMGAFKNADDTSHDVTCQSWTMLYSRRQTTKALRRWCWQRRSPR